LAQGQEQVNTLIAQAANDAQKVRERLIKEAEAEAHRLTDMTRRQLEEDKNKVVRDLRKEVAGLSILAAEKIMRHSMNQKAQEDLLKDFFDDIDKQKGKEQLH